MSDSTGRIGPSQQPRMIPVQEGKLGDQIVEQGVGAEPQTDKSVPSNASVKLPITALLDRHVKVGRKSTKIQPDAPAKIANISQNMKKAADKYSQAIEDALKLVGDERKKALESAKDITFSGNKNCIC